jgi:hypothetical protein
VNPVKWCCLGLFWLAGAAWAEAPGDFYTAWVPVKERSEAAHAEALQQGLRQVLVKLSGSQAVLSQPAVQKALPKAAQWVEQYEYRNQPPVPGGEAPLTLVARFFPAEIDQLLKQTGGGQWGKDRPLLLVWLALNTRLLNEEESPKEAEAVQTVAAQRGLPVLFPLLDLDDRLALPPTLLAAGQEQAMRQAAQRYAPGALLAGTLESGPDNTWQARWYLLGGQTRVVWASRHANLSGLLDEALGKVAESLSARFGAPGSASPSLVEVQITEVVGMQAYAQVQSYLAALDTVENFQVRQVEGDRLRLSVLAKGGRAGLAQAIALGRLLQPIAAPAPAAPDAPLVYRLSKTR